VYQILYNLIFLDPSIIIIVLFSNLSNNFRKYKEIIQDSKQRIKDFKSALLNIEHCEATGMKITFNMHEKFVI